MNEIKNKIENKRNEIKKRHKETQKDERCFYQLSKRGTNFV